MTAAATFLSATRWCRTIRPTHCNNTSSVEPIIAPGIVNSNLTSVPTAGNSSAANKRPFAETSSVTPGYSRSAVRSTTSRCSGKRTAARTGMLSYNRYRVAKRPSFRELPKSQELPKTIVTTNSSVTRVTKEFYCTPNGLDDPFNVHHPLSQPPSPVSAPDRRLSPPAPPSVLHRNRREISSPPIAKPARIRDT